MKYQELRERNKALGEELVKCRIELQKDVEAFIKNKKAFDNYYTQVDELKQRVQIQNATIRMQQATIQNYKDIWTKLGLF